MEKRVNREIQEKHLRYLVQNKGGFSFTETFFPYTSGEIGSYYVQSAAILANGQHFREACDDMEALVRKNMLNTSAISGGESRDWMFSFPIADRLGLDKAMIYKNGKILGADLQGKRVLHVADLNNEGSSIRDLWVPAIIKAGGVIEQVYFYVDRIEDGAKVVKDLGLKSYALVPLDEHTWDYLQQQEVITKEVYNSLKERMEDKDAWARNMLRSDVGIERFVELALDPNTRSKVDNIMTKGYPDMQDELIGILTDKTNLDMDAWVKGM